MWPGPIFWPARSPLVTWPIVTLPGRIWWPALLWPCQAPKGNLPWSGLVPGCDQSHCDWTWLLCRPCCTVLSSLLWPGLVWSPDLVLNGILIWSGLMWKPDLVTYGNLTSSGLMWRPKLVWSHVENWRGLQSHVVNWPGLLSCWKLNWSYLMRKPDMTWPGINTFASLHHCNLTYDKKPEVSSWEVAWLLTRPCPVVVLVSAASYFLPCFLPPTVVF